jgi:tetratricopeptide (TPR) repeat protein
MGGSGMAEASAPLEVFCCYSHEDETWLRKLETHLSLLQRQGLISLWYDRLICPGTDWSKAIDTHLETASVILLLVSADFLASDYCYSVEMKRALERHAANEAYVVPILVHSVDWRGAPFAHLQVLPTDAKPIASWQSQDRALADVAVGIRRVIEDVSLLAASVPHAALPSIWNIPYTRNPFFVGRETELAQLHQHLQAGQTTALSRPQVISGLGGIGKTQIAVEYAYRHLQDYQAVLWTLADTLESLISGYVTIAGLLNLPEKNEQDQVLVVKAVQRWLMTHTRWLLIFDNADDLTMVLEFFPPVGRGHILLTARAQATGALASRIAVETMDREESIFFLLKRAMALGPDVPLSEAKQQDYAAAKEIVEVVDGFPLVLDQVGAYIEETGMSLSNYLKLREDVLAREGRFSKEHPESIETSWLLSFQQIKRINPAAAELLYFCAFLASDAIPETFIRTGASELGRVLGPVAADPMKLNEAIKLLRKFSLIRRNAESNMLSMHRLVQAVVRETMASKKNRLWVERAMRAVNAAFICVENGIWSQYEWLLPQAVRVADLVVQYSLVNEETWRLLHKTASYLHIHARYSEAKPLYLQALSIFEQTLGPEHLQVATTLFHLANLCADQGKYVEAEPLYQRALRIRELQLGPEHPETAEIFYNLARLCEIQDRGEEASMWYTHALTGRSQALGEHHPKTTETRIRLITLLHSLGRYEQAAQLEASQSEP